jgi:hypothetical protein
MNKIKFSSDYPKLWGQKSAILLNVLLIEKNEFPLDKDLVEYDTKNCDGTYYPLPKNKYIQLVFLGNKRIPFCTIRRFTEEKYKYYFYNQKTDFEIVIETKGVEK